MNADYWNEDYWNEDYDDDYDEEKEWENIFKEIKALKEETR